MASLALDPECGNLNPDLVLSQIPDHPSPNWARICNAASPALALPVPRRSPSPAPVTLSPAPTPFASPGEQARRTFTHDASRDGPLRSPDPLKRPGRPPPRGPTARGQCRRRVELRANACTRIADARENSSQVALGIIFNTAVFNTAEQRRGRRGRVGAAPICRCGAVSRLRATGRPPSR
jgi:hypothetical protein